MQDKKLQIVDKILNSLISHYGLRSMKGLADFIKVKDGTLGAWKSRGKIAKPEKIIAKCKGISANWLLTGEGEMFTMGSQGKAPGKHLKIELKDEIEVKDNIQVNINYDPNFGAILKWLQYEFEAGGGERLFEVVEELSETNISYQEYRTEQKKQKGSNTKTEFLKKRIGNG